MSDPLPPADNPEVEKDTPLSDTPPGKDIQVGSKILRQLVKRLIEAMTAEISASTSHNVEGKIFSLSSMFPIGESPDLEYNPLLAFKVNGDPDTMYLHEALKEPYRAQFIKAMLKEVSDQMGNGNFLIIYKSEVPKYVKDLPAVWQMKRKRDIKSRKANKWKARLNIDRSRTTKGVQYDHTYAPVESWNSIRMLLTQTALHRWHTKQLDYVLAFPQAPVERDLYMKITAGLEIENVKNHDYVLKVHRNIYGQKQDGRVWNHYLVNKLVNELSFKQSKVDKCVFYRGQTLYVLYTDNSILADPSEKDIDHIIKDLRKAKLDLTIEGNLHYF